jgi:hypothetical protein
MAVPTIWRKLLQMFRQRTWRLAKSEYHWLDCAKKRSLSHPKNITRSEKELQHVVFVH